MAYNLTKKLSRPWDEVIAAVKGGLKEQGFGVLTEIDMRATLREKIGAELRPYLILGACSPSFAFKAIEAEGGIGVLLPCNVLIRELEGGSIEVSTVNPAESMRAVRNAALEPLAGEIGARLEKMLASLG